MNRRRFSLNAIASSDGVHTRVIHDRRANTTGRTSYKYCGQEVILTGNNVFLKKNGCWLGYLHVDRRGIKYIHGPHNMGRIYEA